MPRATRSTSARTSGATTPSTPVTEVSHMFGLASVRSSTGTSPTSGADDEDTDMLPVIPVSRSVSGGSETESMLGKRRRELACVEIPTKRPAGRAKQQISDGEDDELLLTPSRRPSTRAKPSAVAKGKQKEVIPPTDDEAGSDNSLEYNEDIEESEDSGSEFEASEADEDSDAAVTSTATALARKARDASPDMDEAEGDMVAAAIKESLISTRSSARKGGAKAKLHSLSDAEDEDFESELSAIEISDSDDDQPVAIGSGKKAAAKGKGKGKAKVEPSSSNGKIMTMKALKAKKAAERREKAAGKKTVKQQERALAKEYGRPLIQSEKNVIRLHKEHPELIGVWDNVQVEHKPITPEKAPQPANLKVTLLPFQRESLFWMRKQENSVWKGGLLADEMGMGKTIQIISLLVSDGRKPNLVVAPTVAVMQWRNEIQAHTDGLKVLVWHGAGRESNAKTMASYDVVLTTFAVLESSFRKQHNGFKRKGQIIKEKSLPHQMKWHRVVLDEAHNIKERSTNTAKATFELQSEYKWCLSGTPLQNRVGELYSLIRFIGADPFAYYFCKACDCKSLHWKFTDKRHCDQCGCTPMQHTCFWNNEVLTPIQKCGMEGAGLTAFKKLRVLLDRLMLRRTKIERADDLGLPPRTVIVRRDYFSEEEKELYTSLFSDVQRKFSTYIKEGTVLNNYSNIFSLLTRMRQMACHPDLVLRSKNNEGKFLIEDESEESMVCRLCNDVVEDAIKAKCNHVFDRECIKQYLNTAIEKTPACPVCHLPLTIDLEAPALEIEGTSNARQGMLGRLNLSTWRSSTKIEALIEELTNLRKQDSTTKSIVFSQFVNFLDLIAYRLQRAGFVICRLEGNMSPQARDLTIKHFMNNVHVTVFLVSLKAGGVALNLTEANRVYLMDSWWNPAVEFQAMDRIHRLGQHRPVQAIKLVVEDSIESRIVQLQEKKSAMVDATLSTDDSAMGRLTPEDLGFLFRL